MNENHYPEETYHQYLDHELDAPTRQDFEVHIAQCQVCTQHLAALEQFFGQIAALPELDLEIDLTDQVLSKISYLDAPLPRAIRRTSNIQIAVSLVLLILSFPLIGQVQIPEFNLTIPAIELPVFDVNQFVLDVQNLWSDFQVPQFQDLVQISPLPELPPLGISQSILFQLLISAGVLWWFANQIFLFKYSNYRG